MKDFLDKQDAQLWRKKHWWWRFRHGKGTLFE
jgi:hypothetical protein